MHKGPSDGPQLRPQPTKARSPRAEGDRKPSFPGLLEARSCPSPGTNSPYPEAEEESDSAEPQNLVAEDLTKRRSERVILSARRTQLDFFPGAGKPETALGILDVSGLPKDTQVLGLESDACFSLA